jgi:Tol biopolymer transport system component
VAGDTKGSWQVFVRDYTTGATTRVSVAVAGGRGNSNSLEPSISADGRFVAFSSRASNLVAGDTNRSEDIFVRDRTTGATTRVSVDGAGNQVNGDSERPSISADGRLVAFASEADNLVAGDTNGLEDVFVRDRATGAITRVSVDGAGNQANSGSHYPSISADGRFVAFHSAADNLVAGDTNGLEDVFVRDRTTGATTQVSVAGAGNQGNSDSFVPSISADGRFVAFGSTADNLVAGDTNGYADVFIHDRQTGATTRVSVDNAGNQGNSHSFGPSISADGRFVAFYSLAHNLVAGDTNLREDVLVRDRWEPAPPD